jgi:hypothetical protein
MRDLPRQVRFAMGGRRLAVVHGAASRINRFVFASTPAEEKSRELDQVNADGIVAGHCGLPFTDVIDGRLWHNAGAIGLPANDGTPRVWYSVLTPEPSGIRIDHHALSYDHAGAAAAMRAGGLPPDYAEALASGLWPSLDVLPPVERVATGEPLVESTTFWNPGV